MRLQRSLALLAILASPASAATLSVTPGSGQNLGMTLDGSGNSIYGSMICGGAAATLYTVCANQLEVNSSGQALTLSSESGTWNITNITGTVSLPTGAATAANQEVTAAGTSAASAQAIQGVTGGIAMPITDANGAIQAGVSVPINISTATTTLLVASATSG